MRKWRPTYKAIYVIPEVHGNMKSLEIILTRILPLRFSIGQDDVLIMLGDYIDGHDDGAYVIEALINVKNEDENVIFLRGNHEEFMLKAISGDEKDFAHWIENGGISTISSYLRMNNLKSDPYSIPRNRIYDIVPKHHLDFLNGLQYTHVCDDYFFMHGSFNHQKSIAENSLTNFALDDTASKYVKTSVKNNEKLAFIDDYIYVAAHNFMSEVPFIHQKYMMLGGAAPAKLHLFELNSMTAAMIKNGKSRIYKYNFKIYE